MNSSLHKHKNGYHMNNYKNNNGHNVKIVMLDYLTE